MVHYPLSLLIVNRLRIETKRDVHCSLRGRFFILLDTTFDRHRIYVDKLARPIHRTYLSCSPAG